MKDLDSEELQAILDAIDDSLASWQVLYREVTPSQPLETTVPLASVGESADWLKMSSAPLYASQGVGGARGLVYRLLNLVVKALGVPQIGFNRRLRDFLGELMLSLQGFNQQAQALQSRIEEQQQQIRALQQENSDLREETEWLGEQIAEMRADLDRAKSKLDLQERA